MNAIKTFCAVMAALVLSACGKSVDLSKPEFAVGAYWESLASDNVAQFLTTVGDSKEGKALDKESQVFFTERFAQLAKTFKGNIKTITVTEVKYDESKSTAQVLSLIHI